jgi:5-bromo-4-chloroindolyl phosphate hydrolysis protein
LKADRPASTSNSIARRVSSRDRSTAATPERPRRAWTLRIAPFLLAVPLVTNLLAGDVVQIVALAVSLALLLGACALVEAGLAREADYHARTIAKAPRPPRKLLGAMLAGIAVLVGAWWGAGTGPALAVVLAAAAAIGCGLAYGRDPRQDKGLAPELARKAGVKTEQVIEAITEADAKLREIEHLAGSLHNRELTGRLDRIVAQGRAVLAQIEKDPSDLRRARRFLVTYLDGTRDVVRKYQAQQKDLADTELAESFRHVLDTVERVFAEQEDVLKRNETMDLEVQIEVLRTQLEREGVA